MMQNLLRTFVSDAPEPASEPTPKKLNISALDPYPDNPRRAPHPRYESLKASIEAKGLLEPLIVSRRPHAPGGRYTLIAGGGTRLQILAELTEQHGPGRYDTVECHYREWPGDEEVLAAHLIENDERAGLTWLDQARSVDILRQRLERADQTTFTLQQLVAELNKLGVITHANVLSLQRFTLDVLTDALPKALRSGWGRTRVSEARATYKAACALYRAGEAVSDELAGRWVNEQFRAADAENLATASLTDYVLEQLSIKLQVSLAAVKDQHKVFVDGKTINPKALRPVVAEPPVQAYPPTTKAQRTAGRPCLSEAEKRQQRLQRSAAAYAKAINVTITQTDTAYQLKTPANGPRSWLLAAAAGNPVAAPTVDQWLDSLKELNEKQWGETLKLLSCYRERRS